MTLLQLLSSLKERGVRAALREVLHARSRGRSTAEIVSLLRECSRNPDRWETAMRPIETSRWEARKIGSYGLDGLDARLDALIRKDRGFYVEAGANDGLQQSNTLRLEQHRGWRGILIEPVQRLYEACSANRPKAIVEHRALVSYADPRSEIPMIDCGLMSIVDGAMKSKAMQESHLRKGAQCQNLEPRAEQVPAEPLGSILDRHGIRDFDLLSLDVEGSEMQALQGMDLNRHRPTYILVEARFQEDIESVICPSYEFLCQLSHHDRLYLRSGEAGTRRAVTKSPPQ